MDFTLSSQGMVMINNISQLHSYRESISPTQKVGFVPTMGFLHAGHLSLVDSSVKENDKTIVSIFVNPTQFGRGEDFTSYPRDTKADIAMLLDHGVDAVFIPLAEEIYPPDYRTFVEISDLSEKYCGASRPGHFRGVATIVCKLLNLIHPHFMYMGEKDFQQCLVLEQMCRDLHLPTTIKRCPIVREEDGLALSSRNTYLSAQQRGYATCLYQSLLLAKELVKNGVRDTEALVESMRQLIVNNQGVVDYIVFVDERNLAEQVSVDEHSRVLMAVRVGSTRLIDNMRMG